VSRSATGEEGNGESRGGVASEDLSIIAFTSSATNLVEDDKNGRSDVFVLERSTGRMTRIAPRSR
jgi:hypothetical protein